MKKIKVLSLFDGISCGRVALERAGIPVEAYYSSEIDKYAMQISKKNWLDIIQLGDINNWREWDIDFSQIDLLLAGFPCQAWSVAGKQGGDSDPRGQLVHTLIEIWNEIKKHNPNMKFLFENVKMKKDFIQYINNLFGVEPIMINSSLVCPAERKRLYWTNIPNIQQPKDRNINLKDVVLPAESVSDKYWYSKYEVVYNGADKKVEATLLLNGHRQSKEVYNLNSKCNTLLCDGNGGNLVKKVYQNGKVRKLIPLEYERIQTLPDFYTDGVSDSARYTAIGNGWTVDVISHILKQIIC